MATINVKEKSEVTSGTSFPELIAVTDSKQPVVEKVQQLPQPPFRENNDEIQDIKDIGSSL